MIPRWPRRCGPGRAYAHDWLAKGFATWIDEGLVAPIAPPEVLATVFRALVIGFETQHRIDPDSLDTAVVASALALVTGAAPVTDRNATMVASHHR